jgi:hypothetical protein
MRPRLDRETLAHCPARLLPAKLLSAATRSSTRRTRRPPNEVSTSMAGYSRVQSSTIVNIRITLPLPSLPLAKNCGLNISTPTLTISNGNRDIISRLPSRYQSSDRVRWSPVAGVADALGIDPVVGNRRQRRGEDGQWPARAKACLVRICFHRSTLRGFSVPRGPTTETSVVSRADNYLNLVFPN